MWQYGSGVCSKKEWALPHMPDVEVVSTLDGNSKRLLDERIVKQSAMSDLCVKLSGNRHEGSSKEVVLTTTLSQ